MTSSTLQRLQPATRPAHAACLFALRRAALLGAGLAKARCRAARVKEGVAAAALQQADDEHVDAALQRPHAPGGPGAPGGRAQRRRPHFARRGGPPPTHGRADLLRADGCARARPPHRSARSLALYAAAASAVRGCAGQSQKHLQSKAPPRINRCPDREHAGRMPRLQQCQDQLPRGQAGQLEPPPRATIAPGQQKVARGGRTRARHHAPARRPVSPAPNPHRAGTQAGWL